MLPAFSPYRPESQGLSGPGRMPNLESFVRLRGEEKGIDGNPVVYGLFHGYVDFGIGNLLRWFRSGIFGCAVFLQTASEEFMGGDPHLRDWANEEETDRGSRVSNPNLGPSQK